MGWSLLLSDQGYLVYRQEQKTVAKLKGELETLRSERERLAKEILRLRNDPGALEQLVHDELGYVHNDEFILIMPEDKVEKAEVKKHE